MNTDGLLDDLNEEQLSAVTHGEGPLMIIAGAGTGKTTVITKRISWLIGYKKVDPAAILALTFTEKAATEMEERLDRLLPIGYLDLNVSTFHAFCEKVLRTDGIHIGIPDNFSLATEVDTWLLMRRNLTRFSLDYFRPKGNPTKFLQVLLKHFSRAKDEGITAAQYQLAIEELVAGKIGSETLALENLSSEDKLDIKQWQELSHAYAMYEKILAEKNVIDFGGLLLYTLNLFEERPNILKKYRDKFQYIVVDEFQDTNTIQYKLIKLLAEPKRNLTVVGDDDQAIYKFRGAALANILQFRSDFTEAKKVVLTSNYRSGRAVLDAAYQLIQQNNPHRLEVKEGLSKMLVAKQDETGFVEHIHATTLAAEVEAVIKEIAKHKAQGAMWSDFAVLVRANDSAQPFLEAFEECGIPYQFMALSGLYTKPIILDLLAYLRVVSDPYNSPSFYRILSHPRLGISAEDLSELMMYAKRKGLAINDAVNSLQQTYGISLDGRNKLISLITILNDLRDKSKRLAVTELCVEILKKSGLLQDIQLLTEPEQQEFFKYLDSFIYRLKRFILASPDDKHVRSFLEEFDAERASGEDGGLSQDPEDGPDVVKVMTVHAAKGLEFKYVFIVNLIEQRFPSISRTDSLPLPSNLLPPILEADDHIAEERRLLYVAMTRAKEGLYLLSADDYGGTRKRKPSRFLQELTINKTAVGQMVNIANNQQKTNKNSVEEKKTLYSLPKRFSFSQIAAFSTCPQQYKYAHILKVPTFGRHSLSFGRSMHSTLERFISRLMESQAVVQTSLFSEQAPKAGSIPSAKELIDIFNECFIDEWYPSAEIRDEYLTKGKEALKIFHAQIVANPPKPFLLEAGFTCKIKDILLKGRIDRIDAVDGGYEIIDYKTGNPKKELRWEDKRQLILYVIAANECFNPPLLIKKLTYYYIETNESVSFVPTEKEVNKLKEEIIETVGLIRQQDFTAKPGQPCQYCDFKDICPFQV